MGRGADGWRPAWRRTRPAHPLGQSVRDRGERGPGGEHVVDQHDQPPARQRRTAPRRPDWAEHERGRALAARARAVQVGRVGPRQRPQRRATPAGRPRSQQPARPPAGQPQHVVAVAGPHRGRRGRDRYQRQRDAMPGPPARRPRRAPRPAAGPGHAGRAPCRRGSAPAARRRTRRPRGTAAGRRAPAWAGSRPAVRPGRRGTRYIRRRGRPPTHRPRSRRAEQDRPRSRAYGHPLATNRPSISDTLPSLAHLCSFRHPAGVPCGQPGGLWKTHRRELAGHPAKNGATIPGSWPPNEVTKTKARGGVSREDDELARSRGRSGRVGDDVGRTKSFNFPDRFSATTLSAVTRHIAGLPPAVPVTYSHDSLAQEIAPAVSCPATHGGGPDRRSPCRRRTSATRRRPARMPRTRPGVHLGRRRSGRRHH